MYERRSIEGWKPGLTVPSSPRSWPAFLLTLLHWDSCQKRTQWAEERARPQAAKIVADCAIRSLSGQKSYKDP